MEPSRSKPVLLKSRAHEEEAPKQTERPRLSLVASHQWRRCLTGVGGVAAPTQASTSFPPPPVLAWTLAASETFRHRSLSGAGRPGGFSQVFPTRPAPESHRGGGGGGERLQPFVTQPVRAWLRMTGDGCVKQLSSPSEWREDDG